MCMHNIITLYDSPTAVMQMKFVQLETDFKVRH